MAITSITSTISTVAKRSSVNRCPWCTRFFPQQQAILNSRPAKAIGHGAWALPKRTTAAFSTSVTHRAASMVQPSLWSSLVPKAFRGPASLTAPNVASFPGGKQKNRGQSKGRFSRLVRFWRNPVTPFLLLGLLLGSQSVRLIVLRMDREKVREKAEARLRTLKEVLEAVMAGEDVDVRARLGTGNEQDEREWEEVIRNLATDEIVLKSRRAAWRERKEAQKRDMQGRAADTDRASNTAARTAAAREIHLEEESAPAKETMNEGKRRRVQAEFY